MAYKRRRVESNTSSRLSRPPSSARASNAGPSSSARSALLSNRPSAARSLAPSTPALPALPSQKRISFGPSGPRSYTAKSFIDQDVVRAVYFESEAEMRDREDGDAVNETIMAIDLRDRGTVGCAYYVAREERLYLMEDIKMAGMEIIDTLKVHAQPTIILINTKSDEKLEEHLAPDARRIDRGEEASKNQLTPHIATC